MMVPVEDDFELPEDDDFYTPMDGVIGDAGLLVLTLEDLRVHGRVWAIAHTKAEELLAWLRYAIGETIQERTDVEVEAEMNAQWGD